MSKNLTESNAQPPEDDGTGLRGGTQTGGPAAAAHPLTGTPGGTNALSPAGGAHPTAGASEPPTAEKAAADREDPHRGLGEGRTRPSPDVAAQRARDAAHVPGSRSGVDEDNPKQIPDDRPEDHEADAG